MGVGGNRGGGKGNIFFTSVCVPVDSEVFPTLGWLFPVDGPEREKGLVLLYMSALLHRCTVPGLLCKGLWIGRRWCLIRSGARVCPD